MADTLLGPAYIAIEDFTARAADFGCGGPAIASFSPGQIEMVLATASRAIEGYTNRTYTANPQLETHFVDFYTRRVRVDKPPVALVNSVTLQTYPVAVTVLVSQLIVNNQENYIEIPMAQLGPPLNGCEYPMVAISYNTAQIMPPQAVISATGFVAAEIINRNYLNAITRGGLKSVETGKQSFTRMDFNPDIKSIPEIARQILAGDSTVAPRVVPRGYPTRYLRSGPQYRVP